MRAIILGILLSVASIETTLAADAMTGRELRDLLGQGKELILGGKTMGYTGRLVLSANGTGLGQAKLNDGTTVPIKGIWHIKGNNFCRTWEAGRDAGKEICELWVKSGKNSVRVMVGKKEYGVNSWK